MNRQRTGRKQGAMNVPHKTVENGQLRRMHTDTSGNI